MINKKAEFEPEYSLFILTVIGFIVWINYLVWMNLDSNWTFTGWNSHGFSLLTASITFLVILELSFIVFIFFTKKSDKENWFTYTLINKLKALIIPITFFSILIPLLDGIKYFVKIIQIDWQDMLSMLLTILIIVIIILGIVGFFLINVGIAKLLARTKKSKAKR